MSDILRRPRSLRCLPPTMWDSVMYQLKLPGASVFSKGRNVPVNLPRPCSTPSSSVSKSSRLILRYSAMKSHTYEAKDSRALITAFR